MARVAALLQVDAAQDDIADLCSIGALVPHICPVLTDVGVFFSRLSYDSHTMPDDSQHEFQRLQIYYRSLSDEELRLLSEDARELSDIARQALEQELSRRSMEPVPQAETESDDADRNEQDLVTVAQYRDLADALLAQGMLNSSGIECVVADDNMIRLDWFISNLLGGVKLRVREQDAESALALLEQGIPESFDVEGVGEYRQPRCPSCHSLEIGFEEFNKGLALTSAYLMAPVPLRRDKWKCGECGHEWSQGDQAKE